MDAAKLRSWPFESDPPVGLFWLPALSVSDGAPVAPDEDGWVTLEAGTYVFPVPVGDYNLESFNVITDGTIAFSGLTVEDTNAPSSGPGAVTDWDDSDDSTWVPENPEDAYIGTKGSGWTVNDATLVKTAAKGAAMIHVGSLGASRSRLKVVVTTGGDMRVAPFGKL